jgi:hypothetical protein
MESGFLLNIVIAQGASILELLSSKNQTLLIRRNALLVLNLGLDRINGVGRLYIERNSLAYLTQCVIRVRHYDSEMAESSEGGHANCQMVTTASRGQ